MHRPVTMRLTYLLMEVGESHIQVPLNQVVVLLNLLAIYLPMDIPALSMILAEEVESEGARNKGQLASMAFGD